MQPDMPVSRYLTPLAGDALVDPARGHIAFLESAGSMRLVGSLSLLTILVQWMYIIQTCSDKFVSLLSFVLLV